VGASNPIRVLYIVGKLKLLNSSRLAGLNILLDLDIIKSDNILSLLVLWFRFVAKVGVRMSSISVSERGLDVDFG
jgi:hypothetical protein